jgi:hypothetical protein
MVDYLGNHELMWQNGTCELLRRSFEDRGGVIGAQKEASKTALAQFSESKGIPKANQAYISANSNDVVSISGPPETTASLLEHSEYLRASGHSHLTYLHLSMHHIYTVMTMLRKWCNHSLTRMRRGSSSFPSSQASELDTLRFGC